MFDTVLALMHAYYTMQTKQVAQTLSRSMGTKAQRRALVRVAAIVLVILAILLQVATIYTQVVSGYGILLLAASFLPAHVRYFMGEHRKKSEMLTTHVPSKTTPDGTTNAPVSEDAFKNMVLHVTFVLFAYYVSPGMTFAPVNPNTAFDFVGDLYG